MTLEEILIKLNMDGSPVSQGVSKMNSELKEAGKHGHKNFLHLSSGAKELHKAVHEIANEAPVMGGALRLAMSPIGGAIAAATTAFAVFHQWLEKVNKDLDAMEKTNRQPLGNVKQAIADASKEMAQMSAQMKEWEKNLYVHPMRDASEKMDRTISGIGRNASRQEKYIQEQLKLGTIDQGQADIALKFIREQSMGRQALTQARAIDAVTKAQAVAIEQRKKAELAATDPHRLKEMKDLPNLIKDAEKMAALHAGKAEEESPDDETMASAWWRQMTALGITREERQKMAEKVIERLKQRQERLTDEHKRAQDRLGQTQKVEGELNAERERLNRELYGTKEDLKDSGGGLMPRLVPNLRAGPIPDYMEVIRQGIPVRIKEVAP